MLMKYYILRSAVQYIAQFATDLYACNNNNQTMAMENELVEQLQKKNCFVLSFI